jgi:2-polyprenyl-3-methyl-5-hydroxy-6-metoxy-1,4-benzoquinol methylase
MHEEFPELGLAERNRLALRWTPNGASTLLDAGCSWGYATRFFTERAHRVAGIDVDERAIGVASERYPEIDFRAAPLEAIPHPDEAFDVVLCLDVLEHVQDERRSLDELFRVLRPGGTLILSTPHRGAFSFLDPVNVLRRLGRIDEPEHRHYSVADLRRLLDASGWAGGYEVVRSHRGGLLLYPLALWVVASPHVPRGLKSVAQLGIELDYLIPWGRASYSVSLKIRKAQPGS